MSRNAKIARLLAGEQGEGIVTALILLAGVLIPLIYLVALFGRIEQGRLAVSQAAEAAVRAAVEAPTPTAAQAAAEQQLADEQAQTHTPLRLELGGSFERGSVIEADVSGQVAIGHLPLLGDFGTITVHASARAPVDRYRSLPAGAQ
jgi:hypothetical protein